MLPNLTLFQRWWWPCHIWIWPLQFRTLSQHSFLKYNKSGSHKKRRWRFRCQWSTDNSLRKLIERAHNQNFASAWKKIRLAQQTARRNFLCGPQNTRRGLLSLFWSYKQPFNIDIHVFYVYMYVIWPFTIKKLPA